MAVHNIVRDFGSYDRMMEQFRYTDIYDDADWDAPERLNVGHEACDRHANGGDAVAIQHVDRGGVHRRVSFEELTGSSNAFANLLEGIGVDQGDRVFTYLPRIPAHYVTLLGTLKAGAVFGAINERFGEEGIAYRLDDSDASVVVTTDENLRNVLSAIGDGGSVEDVIVVGDLTGPEGREDVDMHEYATALEARSEAYDPMNTDAGDNALLYYTSGTTGLPKGVVHTHSWITGAATLAKYIEDLGPNDLYWSTADMGWLTGPLHCLGPWFWGREVFVYEGTFDVGRWAGLLEEYDVSVLHTVPTVYRSFRENEDAIREHDIDLRHASSVGEPLEPSTIEWIETHLGVEIHDTYGQTECGGIVVTNIPTLEVKQGSMGKSMPGVEVDVIDQETTETMGPNETGEIAWRSGSPAFFEAYWNRNGLKAESVVDGWYRSGDLAYRDEDGYFWFEGRADDVILSSGYRIGPFEVEKSISEHPAVTEAAVVPKPDQTRGNIVKAYVSLQSGYDAGEDLKADIKGIVRDSLSKHKYPREIEFVEDFPRTVTGKIKRTDLKEREAKHASK